METMTDFIFLSSKITAGDDCSHEIKRHLLLGRKAMTNLDSILKSRDVILLAKVHVVKAMVFPVVLYGCESGTISKAQHWRIDAFELWCWRRLFKVFRLQGNQHWIFIGRTDAEAEAEIPWPPDVKRWLIGKDPDAGKDWRQEEKGQQRMRWMSSPTQWMWFWASSGNRSWTGKPGMLQSIGLQRVGHDLVTEQQRQHRLNA